MSNNECLNGKLGNIGYEDEVRDYRATRFAEHLKACNEFGVLPDLEEYTA